MTETKYVAKAFVSCSLREEDKPFVDHVCNILKTHKFEPFGTVGKFSASPENPISLMNSNIPKADFVVICATPRYLQKDLKTGKKSMGLSEMVHVETGMALAHGKPVVVFVQEGTQIGNVLPNITQYIELNGEHDDFLAKRTLIESLFDHTCQYLETVRNNNQVKTAVNAAVVIFAIIGFFSVVGAIFRRSEK
jgi:hypothetical protein